LRSLRLAVPFEALRDKADLHKQATGGLPKVFLASLGPIAAHTLRSTWMKNLLAAGGIEAIVSEGYVTAEQATEAFKASGARVACICSSEDIYAQMGEGTARGLKEAGAGRVMLAGRPGDAEAGLTAAGVDSFVFAGQDILALLTELQEHLIAD
jgi:methylmalonyl-CoA mutase